MPEDRGQEGDTAGGRWGLPPRVWRLGWISFFADVASEMAYPLVPLFLAHTLRSSAAALGLIEGCAEAVVSAIKGWSGWRSDATASRMPYVRLGYGLGAIAKPLLAVAINWQTVWVARTIDRLGKGLRTSPRDALLADSARPGQVGAAFGLHRAMDTAGALVGVALSLGLLAWFPSNYRLVFLLAVVPGAISVWLTFGLRERGPASRGVGKVADLSPSRSIRQVLRGLPGGYWSALGVSVILALASASDAFLLLFGSKLGYSDTAVVGCYMLFNLTYTLTSFPAGRWSDRIGRWWVLALGWVLYTCVYFGVAWSPAAWLPCWFGAYGVSVGLTQGVGRALIADFAPADSRGTALGLYHMLTGVGLLAASAGFGILWGIPSVGPSGAFQVAGCLAALGAVGLVSIAVRRPHRPHRGMEGA